jgi:hypothetical protein
MGAQPSSESMHEVLPVSTLATHSPSDAADPRGPISGLPYAERARRLSQGAGTEGRCRAGKGGDEMQHGAHVATPRRDLPDRPAMDAAEPRPDVTAQGAGPPSGAFHPSIAAPKTGISAGEQGAGAAISFSPAGELPELRSSHEVVSKAARSISPAPELRIGPEVGSGQGWEPGWVTAFREVVSLAVNTPLPQSNSASPATSSGRTSRSGADAHSPASAAVLQLPAGGQAPAGGFSTQRLPLTCSNLQETPTLFGYATPVGRGAPGGAHCAQTSLFCNPSLSASVAGATASSAAGKGHRVSRGWLDAAFSSALSNGQRKRLRAGGSERASPESDLESAYSSTPGMGSS